MKREESSLLSEKELGGEWVGKGVCFYLVLILLPLFVGKRWMEEEDKKQEIANTLILIWKAEKEGIIWSKYFGQDANIPLKVGTLAFRYILKFLLECGDIF